VNTRNRRRSAPPETGNPRGRALRRVTVLLVLAIVLAFLAEGLTGARAAAVVGNIAATALGVLLLFRRG
jgi:hypothetical protein